METDKKLPGKNIERSQKIIEWLKNHPLISRHALCTQVGYDAASLYKIISGTGSYVAIPGKYLDEMEEILSNYGFNLKINETLIHK
jgi:hypothetical protein